MTVNNESTSEKQATTNLLSRLIWASPQAMLSETDANLGLYYAAGVLVPEVTAQPGAGAGQIAGANVVYILIDALAFAATIRITSRPVALACKQCASAPAIEAGAIGYLLKDTRAKNCSV